MWKNDRIKLLIPRNRYTCLDTVITTCYYLTITITVIVSIQLLTTAIGMRLYTLVDLRLFEPYLSLDSNILACVSIFIILASTLGILSAFQHSYFGITTSLSLFILLLGFTDVYTISNYRIKDYLTPTGLYHVLYDALISNPFENIALHLMQQRLACCGINDYTDWIFIYQFIPGSCCNNSSLCDLDDPLLNKNGCLNIVRDILRNTYENTTTTIIVLNIVGIIAIITGYFYSYLLQQLKKADRIMRTAIPRIQKSYNARFPQTGQTLNSRNNTSSVQPIRDQTTPSAPSLIYPNLYSADSAYNL